MFPRLSLLTAGAAAIAAAQLSAQTPPPPRPYVAIGCISVQNASPAPAGRGGATAAAPQYVITDMRGEKPFVYRLDGDPEKLKLHVGHTVEVSGTVSAAAAGKGAAGAPSPPTMKVQGIVWIASSCKQAKTGNDSR